jgi:hypothetical protein
MTSPSKLTWYAHRLMAMRPSEVWHRLKEKWLYRKDHEWITRLHEIDPGPPADQVPTLPHVTAIPWDLRVALKTDASDLLAGRWELFGWRVADVGAPPCWHRDASSGVIVEPEGASYKLDHRSLPTGADARTIWEVNRWSQLTRLAMHGWVDRNLSAFETVQSWLDDWCDRNAVGHGINWTSSLEAALRLMNFTWLDALIMAGGNDAIRVRQQRLARRVVPAHAMWIKRHLSSGSSANNHLLGELTGLLHGVKRWPQMERIVGSANDIWNRIADCVMTQFAPDGGNLEQALHYHLFSLELALHARRLMVIHRPDVTERLKAAAEFFTRMLHPVEPWDFGDSDDAETLPFYISRATNAAEWQAWLSGGQDKSALHYWMGPAPVRNPPPDSHWWLAPQSGMAVGEAAGWLIRADASPLGLGSLAAHGHCDALHISIWDGMHALVIDPGTGGYYGFTERRAALASWDAHNGPTPEGGFTSPRRLGSFLWIKHHARPEMKLAGTDTLAMALKHEGMSFQRRVDVQEDGQLLVVDECSAPTSFTVRWCLAPECKLERLGDDRWLIKRQALRWMVSFSGQQLQVGCQETIVSRHYGSMEPSMCLIITSQQRLESHWTRA